MLDIQYQELDRAINAAVIRFSLKDEASAELRQNVVLGALERKKEWEKFLHKLVWNEAVLLKQGARDRQIQSLSTMDETALAYNDRPKNEPDIFERAIRAEKIQHVIDTLPAKQRALCELLKYVPPEDARKKLGMSRREFQGRCDELQVAFIEAGIEP